MRILVTGSTGFIGGHIRRHFISQGHEVFSCSRSKMDVDSRAKFLLVSGDSALTYQTDAQHFTLDLKDGPSVCKMMSECRPDLIVHCAANPLVKANPDDPTGVYEDNVLSTFLLCHHAPAGCKFLFTSSIVVYGDVPNSTGLGWINSSMKPQPTSMYGVSKVAAENIIHFYKDKLDYGIFRLGATIGKGLTHGIIFDFIKKLKSDSPTLDVLGDEPGSKKPFLYIEDLLSAIDIWLAGKLEVIDNTFNVCNKDYASVLDIAHAVMRAIGIEKQIKWLGASANWKGDNKVLRASIDAMCMAGWMPKKTSIQAIEAAVFGNSQ